MRDLDTMIGFYRATIGLDWFSLHVEDAALPAAQRKRLAGGGSSVSEVENGLRTSDPRGTWLRLIKV